MNTAPFDSAPFDSAQFEPQRGNAAKSDSSATSSAGTTPTVSSISASSSGQASSGGRPRLPQFTWRQSHARGTLSVLISCIVHTCLLLALALSYIATQPEQVAVVLQATLAGAEEVAIDYSDAISAEAPQGAELPQQPEAPVNESFELNLSSDLAASSQKIDATLTAAIAAVSRPGSAGGISSGSGAGVGELPDKLGANFFGSYATGERFVFVLDSSKSMQGDRWLYACQELLDSISRLEPNQKFFLICFDDKTTLMFNVPAARKQYYENTPELRIRLKRWLASRRLGPGTMPAQAMVTALEMQPDAIFMLSDGELRDETLFVLRDVNGFSTERRQVPIHTVHLMSQEGRSTLQTIASENSGTFTPVVGGGRVQ